MLGNSRRKHKLQAGLALIELLITSLILVVVLGGLLQLFIYCQNMGVMAGRLTLALSEAQAEMEGIRNLNFEDIDELNGNSFNLTQLTGRLITYVNEIVADELLEVEIVVSWQAMGSRIIGEDKDLDGVLDAGEDTSSPLNEKLDSPTSLITLIVKR